MDTKQIDDRLQHVQRKLEDISLEVEQHRRHRLEMEELKTDLTSIARDMFDTTVMELEDIAQFVSTGDFLHLLKRLLRNTRTITDLLSKVESAKDFTEEAVSVSRELFYDAMMKLDELDRKGYFNFFRSIGAALDRAVEKLPPEEVEKITENVIMPGIELVSKLADTNLLFVLNRTIDTVREQSPGTFDTFSLWDTYKKSRTKEIRRIMGGTLFLLETLARETNPDQNNRETKNA